MNRRLVLGISLVLLITVFTQCTVEKRLYRNGWHVEFNRKHKSITEDVVNRESVAATIVEKSIVERTTELSEESQQPPILTDSVSVNNTESLNETLKPWQPITEINSNKWTLHAKSSTKITKEQRRPYDQEDKKTKVMILSVLLLLLIGIMILLVIGAGSSTSLGTSIIIALALLLLMPISVVLLLVLLIVLFSKTKQEMAEQKRLEAEEKEKLKDMTPEEQEAYRRESGSVVRSKKSDNIAAAFIAIVIVVLAIFVLTDK